MRRILVVSVNWLGDAIMLTPAFKALKKSIPDAYIAVMAPDRVLDVYRDNPHIDEVIAFDERASQKSLSNRLAFAAELKKKNFDTAFLVHRSFTRALICLLAGIRVRVGYRRLKNFFVLTHPISFNSKIIHRQDQYLYLFEKMGILIEDRRAQFFIANDDRERMQYKLHAEGLSDKRIVGIHASANWLSKRWPVAYFAELSDRLIKELGCAIVFIGAKNDCLVVDRVVEAMHEQAVNFCGKTSLKELAALLEECVVVVSNDSGPAHLASALGVATLVLFGPTSPLVTKPNGKQVRILVKHTQCTKPCYVENCEDIRCMKAITIEDVLLEIKDMLQV